MALKLGTFPDSLRIGNAHERLHLHRFVCDLDPVRDQADGEPQRVTGAAREAGDELLGSTISVMFIKT